MWITRGKTQLPNWKKKNKNGESIEVFVNGVFNCSPYFNRFIHRCGLSPITATSATRQRLVLFVIMQCEKCGIPHCVRICAQSSMLVYYHMLFLQHQLNRKFFSSVWQTTHSSPLPQCFAALTIDNLALAFERLWFLPAKTVKNIVHISYATHSRHQ